ncbi:MAG: signal peptide peptidase SppA, partial [Bacteroidota bacterium]
MKQFFKYFFASVLGTFSAIFLLGVLLFFFILAVTAMIDTEDIVTISPNTILELDLKGELPERSYFDPIGISNLFSTN